MSKVDKVKDGVSAGRCVRGGTCADDSFYPDTSPEDLSVSVTASQPTSVSALDTAVMRVELRVARMLQSVSGMKPLARKLGAFCRHLPTVDAGGVYLLDEKEQAFELMAHWNLSWDFLQTAKRVPVDSARGAVVLVGAVVSIRPGAGTVDCEAEAVMAREGIRSAIMVPMVYQGKALGALNLASRSLDAFPKPVDVAIRSIGVQTAGAFHRFRVEERLRQSEERFRQMIVSFSGAIYVLDPALRFLTVNPALTRMMNLPEDRLLGVSLTDLLPGFTKTSFFRALRHALETGKPCTVTDSFGHPAQSCRWYEVSVTPIKAGLLCMARDVTDHFRLEEMAAASQNQIISAATWEKQNLARVLHDGIGPQLAAMAYLSKAVERALTSRGAPEAEQVRKIGALLQDSKDQLRGLSRVLIPNTTVFNLETRLTQLSESMSVTFGISCRLIQTVNLQGLSGVRAEHLYYIAQEAIMNAVRHGRPDGITVTVSAHEGDLRLEIADDGVGFDVAYVQEDAFGLRVMQHRAARLGGRLTVNSDDRKGTTIVCEIPHFQEMDGPALEGAAAGYLGRIHDES